MLKDVTQCKMLSDQMDGLNFMANERQGLVSDLSLSMSLSISLSSQVSRVFLH